MTPSRWSRPFSTGAAGWVCTGNAARRGDERWLPLINYEHRQCGLLACKALMREGGVIARDAPRHPVAPLHAEMRAGLIETARRLDPMVLRWGR